MAGMRGAAPPNSLTARLALDALLAGNARAVAGLWRAFVTNLRRKYWEPKSGVPQPLPRMAVVERGPSGTFTWVPPDLCSCLFHQKLHMLQICILMRKQEVEWGDEGSPAGPAAPARTWFGGPTWQSPLSPAKVAHLAPGTPPTTPSASFRFP